MSVTNLYDMQKTENLPSPIFLHFKRQSAINRIVREILMKEYQFRSCRALDEDIQKHIYEISNLIANVFLNSATA